MEYHGQSDFVHQRGEWCCPQQRGHQGLEHGSNANIELFQWLCQSHLGRRVFLQQSVSLFINHDPLGSDHLGQWGEHVWHLAHTQLHLRRCVWRGTRRFWRNRLTLLDLERQRQCGGHSKTHQHHQCRRLQCDLCWWIEPGSIHPDEPNASDLVGPKSPFGDQHCWELLRHHHHQPDVLHPHRSGQLGDLGTRNRGDCRPERDDCQQLRDLHCGQDWHGQREQLPNHPQLQCHIGHLHHQHRERERVGAASE